ncbi:hypothetical protein PCL_09369 [Purpureocillium lilacinum]|uniref:Uncharacterized protein n=1 Tax=Purpureocillium lilacinum TaxID=33203 RepID=A0A2U3EHX9_PURLI|nr:hypothetical protein Purlil1_701 [Purpureocillium lilacinum]PWI74093.1 hypothetical protein PCL_09369 [Purpureocillium lilacinum]
MVDVQYLAKLGSLASRNCPESIFDYHVLRHECLHNITLTRAERDEFVLASMPGTGQSKSALLAPFRGITASLVPRAKTYKCPAEASTGRTAYSTACTHLPAERIARTAQSSAQHALPVKCMHGPHIEALTCRPPNKRPPTLSGEGSAQWMDCHSQTRPGRAHPWPREACEIADWLSIRTLHGLSCSSGLDATPHRPPVLPGARHG